MNVNIKPIFVLPRYAVPTESKVAFAGKKRKGEGFIRMKRKGKFSPNPLIELKIMRAWAYFLV